MGKYVKAIRVCLILHDMKKKAVRQLISDSFKDLFIHLRVTLPLFNLSSVIYILRRHMLISYELKFMLPTHECSGEM